MRFPYWMSRLLSVRQATRSNKSRRGRSGPARLEGLETRTLFAGDLAFAFGIGGAGAETGRALDSDGNIYVTGQFTNTVDFDPGAGITQLTAVGASSNAYVAKYSTSGDLLWARGFGGVGATIGSASITADPAGDVVFAGQFTGTIDLDPGVATLQFVSDGGPDAFFCKLDANGDFVWGHRFGSIGTDVARAVAVDSNGNVYGAGTFDQTVFGLTNTGAPDGFLVKLESDGDYLFARQFAGAFTQQMSADALAVDSAGNVHLTGGFIGAVDWDPGAGFFTLPQSGPSDMFLAKLDGEGNLIYAYGFGSSTTPDRGLDLATDSAGHVHVTGLFGGSVDFDPGPDVVTLTAGTGVSTVVLELDSSGDFVKAYHFSGSQRANGIAVDNAGNTYLVGEFTIASDFDPGPGTFNMVSAGSQDAFICKLDGDGNLVYAHRIGSTLLDRAWEIGLDSQNAVYVTGDFSGTVDFDPGLGTYNVTSNGGTDAFVLKLTGDVVPAINTSLTLSAPDVIYDGNPHAATATLDPTTAAGAITYHYTGTGDTWYDSEIAPTNAGSYHVVANFTPDNPAAFNPSSASADFVIARAQLTHIVGNATQEYGDSVGLPNPTVSTGVGDEFLVLYYSSTGNNPTANVGNYAINATVTSGSGLVSNYDVTVVPGTLAVTPKTITHTVGSASHAYGQTVDLGALLGTSINTSVNGETLSIAYSSAGNTTSAAAGNYAITGSIADGTGLASNYNVILTPGLLTVTGATLTGSATSQDTWNLAKQGMLKITLTDLTGLVNGDTLEQFLSTAQYYITIGDSHFVFVPTAVIAEGTTVTIEYRLKDSQLTQDLTAALEYATSHSTAVTAGFHIQSSNYSYTDDFLAELFSTRA